MSKIIVEKPDQAKLDDMGVSSWPIWEKEVSTFPWTYDCEETCYILEGEAVVEAADGEVVEFGTGDLVTFPKGMDCTWDIKSNIRKHYKFG